MYFEENMELSNDIGPNGVRHRLPKNKQAMYRQQIAQRRLTKLLSDSSVAGLSHASSATTEVSRLFWVILLLTGVVGFTSNLYFLIQRYLEEPVLTMFAPENDDFRWPDITFCNPMNPIPFWRDEKLSKKWDELLHRTKAFDNITYRRGKLGHMKHVLLMSSLQPSLFLIGDVQSAIPYITLNVQNYRISESTGYFETFEEISAVHKGFYTRLDSSSFPIPCFTFNPNNVPELMQVTNGSRRLKMVRFFVAMDLCSYRKFDCDYEDQNVHLFVTSPNYALSSRTFYLCSPGTTTTIKINMNRLQRLKRASDCIDERFEAELYDTLMATTRRFMGGFDDCRHFVSQRLFLDKCKCYSPLLPIFKSWQVPPQLCLNMSIFNSSQISANVECMADVADKYSKGTMFNEILDRECLRYQRPLCDEVHYSVSHDSVRWSREISDSRRAYLRGQVRFMPTAPNNSDETFLLKNLAVVTVFRENDKIDLTYEAYEYPTSQFISDIGGIMGLWLGLSVIGLFELVEIVLVFVHFVSTFSCLSCLNPRDGHM